jgi:hypothetical protein
MNRLTHEEHAARAMLMGKVYDWRDRTYCDMNDQGSEPQWDMHERDYAALDADTLEPLTWGECEARIMGNRNEDWRRPPNDDT